MPGTRVYLSCADDPKRRTKYDLITVIKDGRTVNVDSQAPNVVAEEWLRRVLPEAELRREVTYGGSRFDFCITQEEQRSFLEVKGVTLEERGIAMFPDAPTERGVKHLRELIECKAAGYGAGLLFVVKMKGVRYLRPNDRTHPAFGAALREAAAAGVQIRAVDCLVTEDTLTIDAPLPVELAPWER